jgi:hypothetical protein
MGRKIGVESQENTVVLQQGLCEAVNVSKHTLAIGVALVSAAVDMF